jgi:hypothetical protein
LDTRAPWLILGIVLGASLLVPALVAGEEDAAWEQDERRLTFQPTPDGFRFESVRDNDMGNDVLVGSYSTLNRRYTVSYLDNAANMTPLRLTIDFEALVEYQDLDADESYGLGDRIVQRQRVADLGAPNTKVESLPNGASRATYTYSLATPNSDDADADLIIVFTLAPGPQTIDGDIVPPTRPHVEIRVDHFPYENVTSRVAFETRLIGSAALQEESNAFYVSSNERRLVYEWPDQSQVDGDERPVRVTLLGTSGQSGGANAVVLHSYERGEELSYQPIIGAERETPATQNVFVEFFTHGDWRLYGIGVVAAFALIGATVWRRIDRA